MKHQPNRTCVGCRSVVHKEDAVRVVAGPQGMVIDYREKLPGRAAYVCFKQECIEQAVSRGALGRSLKQKLPSVDAQTFSAMLRENIRERIKSLLTVAMKAGMLAIGYSAARDALEKNRVFLLLFAEDLSESTESRLDANESISRVSLFTRDEYGTMFSRELVGIVAILDQGFANAVKSELQRLKSLINQHH
jgi:predicted RNA-binding protein YlxR (DUF448 family)